MSGHEIGWMIDASCAGLATDLFFPDPHTKPEPAVLRVCAACPVRAKCANYAQATGITHGIWGGHPVNVEQTENPRNRWEQVMDELEQLWPITPEAAPEIADRLGTTMNAIARLCANHYRHDLARPFYRAVNIAKRNAA